MFAALLRSGKGTDAGDDQLKVELDRAALFALASDTRLEILKALQSERRTLSQLAVLLDVDKSAVHRHLRKLEDGGLIKRSEDHGFIYHSLTWKARDLISPGENTRIVVLLSTFLIMMVICGILVMVASSGVPEVGEASDNYGTADTPQLVEKVQQVQYALYTVVAMVAVVAVMAAHMAFGLLHRPRQSGAETAEDWKGPEEVREHYLEDQI